MKIALFVHCFFPEHYHGTETYTLQLAVNLQKLNYTPVVVSCIPTGKNKAPELLSTYEYQGIPVYCIDKNQIKDSSLRDSYDNPRMVEIHKKILQEINPDLVHVTHIFNHTAALLEATNDLDIPTVATFTDFFGFCMNNQLQAVDGGLCSGPNPKRTNCFACCVKAVLRKSAASSIFTDRNLTAAAPIIESVSNLYENVHRLPGLKQTTLSSHFRDIKNRPGLLAQRYSNYKAVIAPTRFLQSAYERNGFNEVPIYKINFGVDLDRRPKKIPAQTTPIRFGFIGQIAAHKGTHLLAEAFCRLPAGKGELHIYGAEDQFPSYTKMIKKRCQNHSVFFRGTFASEKMRLVLDEMDFLVIPSTWYENSPLVLLNALASHTPVIVSDVEGLTEFLDQGKNGYAFSRGSVDDLERVMRRILVNPDSSRQLSRTTNYAWTSLSMTEEIVEIYNSVIGSTPL